MGSTFVARIHYFFVNLLLIYYLLVNQLWIHYFFRESTMHFANLLWIHYCFRNLLWIHHLFREFTIFSCYHHLFNVFNYWFNIFSRIYYGFTICFTNSLFFREFTICFANSLFVLRIYSGSNFSEFTMDSPSVSQIHHFFGNLPFIYYICAFTLNPLFFRDFTVDSLSFTRNYHELLVT